MCILACAILGRFVWEWVSIREVRNSTRSFCGVDHREGAEFGFGCDELEWSAVHAQSCANVELFMPGGRGCAVVLSVEAAVVVGHLSRQVVLIGFAQGDAAGWLWQRGAAGFRTGACMYRMATAGRIRIFGGEEPDAP